MTQDEREREIAALRARLADLEAHPIESPELPAGKETVDQAQPTKSADGTTILIVVGGLVLLFVIVISFAGAGAPSSANETPLSNTAAFAEAADNVPDKPLEVPNWTYREEKDEMTDKVTRFACADSSNQVSLSPPYGDVTAQLCLRDSPRFGHDAYVQLLGDGQILCRSYEGCTIGVRFDQQEQERFSATGASDGSSNIIFIDNRSRLETGLKSADQTLIAAEFYEAGVQTMKFDTKGFAWPSHGG